SIIHVCGELDSQGTWQDVNGDGHFNIFLWVKNTGSSRIAAPEMSDLFLGPEGAFGRVVHQSGASGSQPYWTCDVENGDAWDPTTTLKITVHYVSTLESGRYFVKLVLPNGVADDDYFGL
ncbi:MAG: hypothetical protein H5T69_18000, partial [Chloroflexi bacterium]|nr:hypothetical protein [Chloroflexota bacterium]